MKRKHKIELIIVSIIILANSAFLVYQFRFNRKFLYRPAKVLYEQERYDETMPYYVKFLELYHEGEYVEEVRQDLFCRVLPHAKTLLDMSDVAVAIQAFRSSKSRWVRDMAELALIHTGMEASMKPGGKYDSFLRWWSETVGDIGRPPGMVLAPAGEFIMGSPENEKGRRRFAISPYALPLYRYERPQHRVIITKAFYINKFEVTQRQYYAIMGKNPSFFKGANNPVERVSWNDAVEFCRKLSQKGGCEYRLPTEAEWEYACRGGATTRFYYGDDPGYKLLGKYAWHCHDSGSKTHPVGQKQPNALGLYDMHGNVQEWCADWYDERYYKNNPRRDPKGPDSGALRVLRGGDWLMDPPFLRAANRHGCAPKSKFAQFGFRCVVGVE